MKGALDIHRELLGRDIVHEILRLRRVVLDADQIPDVLGVDPDQVVQVRLFMTSAGMVAAATPSGRPARREPLLRACGSATCRPATAQEVNERTEYVAGLVAPMLLPPEIPLLVDARVGRHGVVYTATGDTGTALGIATADLLLTSGARIADLTSESLADIVLDLEV